MVCPETHTESILGYIAIGFEMIHRFPQIYKLYKTKKGDDISEMMLLTQLISICFYISYSLLRTDVIIFVGSMFSIVQNIVIYGMIYKYKKHSLEYKEQLIMEFK